MRLRRLAPDSRGKRADATGLKGQLLWSSLLAALTLVRLIVAACAPLAPDEAYYWVWSRALAPGYLDHPPMVALWIRAGTWLVGPSALGVRLLGPLSAVAGSVLLAQAGGYQAAVLLNATLLFGVGAVTMTPDTPLLFFWIVALWAMVRLIQSGNGAWWLAVGAACGLALDSKYTAGLLPLGLGAWLIWTRQWAWLRRPWPWAAAALGAGLFAPVAWWNAHHGWASFLKQGGRGFLFDPGRMAAHVGELVAGQLALATPLLIVLCGAGVWAACRMAWRERASIPVLLVALSVPGMTVFIEHALGDRVQANWPAVIYPAAAVAAGLAAARWRRWLFAPGVALGTALTALVYVQSAWAPLRLPQHLDPTMRLSSGYVALARDVATLAAARGAQFVAVDDYGNAALLAFANRACLPVIGVEPRWALFDLPDGRAWIAGRRGLLLRSERRRTPPKLADWTQLTRVAAIGRMRDGQLADRLDVYEGTARAGSEPAAMMPCARFK